jgi:hypothetical protein
MVTSFPETCLRAWQAQDLSTCKPLGFDLVGWAAILPVAAGVVFFVVRALRARFARTTNEDRLKARPWRNRFAALCRAIRPIVEENGRIFREFGPNSSAGGPARIVRQNLGVWKQMMPTVAENNARIRKLITANLDSIPQRHAELFERWINHIDAFEAHAEDPLADYRHHQFPREVVDVIHQNA